MNINETIFRTTRNDKNNEVINIVTQARTVHCLYIDNSGPPGGTQ